METAGEVNLLLNLPEVNHLDTALPCAYNHVALFLDSSIRQSGRLLTARFQVRVLVEELILTLMLGVFLIQAVKATPLVNLVNR